MKTRHKSYAGKILLFGEYSVLKGSFAALIPYRRFKAHFSTGEKNTCLNRSLFSFLQYLTGESIHKDTLSFNDSIDTNRLSDDVKKGLYFKSSIPQNKGLGSSGAICAAVYDCYKRKDIQDLPDLRQLFSRMESWFHGNSSGIDPLCIYLNSPLILRNEEYLMINEVTLNRNFIKPFLIDTGTESKTQPLVHHFREQWKQEHYVTGFSNTYIPLVNEAVNQWKDGKLSHNIVADLSMSQLKYFTGMIPDEFRKIWESGLDNGLYSMKLCGSGGGGMLLGFTSKISETENHLRKQFGIKIIPV